MSTLSAGQKRLITSAAYVLGATSVTTPPPEPTAGLPTGAQPTVWLLPTASQSLSDYRGGGYNTVTGTLPIEATYNGKKAWVYDGSTQIKVEGHGLNLGNNVTLLFQVSSNDYSQQHYLATLGNGSGSGLSRFDIYTSGGQFFCRSKGGLDETADASNYFNALSEPNNIILMLNYDEQPVINLLADGTAYVGATTTVFQTSPANFVNEPLYLFSGGANLSIPFASGSRIRSFAVFNQTLTKAKALEWLAYFDTLP